MSGPIVHVVCTGTANLASVLAGLRRAGAEPVLTDDPAVVRGAARVVLPGVGAFGAARAALASGGLDAAIRDRLIDGRPLLAICLGLQLLGAASEESPGVAGLGLFEGAATRITGPVRVPQMGWNRVQPSAGARWVRPGAAYFANSYKFDALPAGWDGSLAHHGGPLVASVERGDVLACQFHPELSGAWGLDLLRRWAHGQPGAPASAGPPGEAGLATRVIPCLDIRDGRVVKGVRFQGLRDAGDPVERARHYEATGADELVILDVSATPEGRGHAVDTTRAVRRELGIPLTVGGGVRAVDDAGRLLDAGADKVGVNTAAFDDPSLLTRIADRFGAQCTVLALDAARHGDGWEVVTRSGTMRTGRDAIAWAVQAVEAGAGELLLTSWDRDGTRAGYDTALLAAMRAAVRVPVIASGGAAHADHLIEAVAAGADAVLAASIFHDGETTPDSIKRQLAAAGLHVR